LFFLFLLPLYPSSTVIAESRGQGETEINEEQGSENIGAGIGSTFSGTGLLENGDSSSMEEEKEEKQTTEKDIKEGSTSEEQTKADCVTTLLGDSKTSDWNVHTLEETRQTCQKQTFQGEVSKSLGKSDVGQELEVDDLSNLGKVDNLSNPSKSKLSSVSNSDIDSVLEPECRDEGGAPASGLSSCLCRGCSYSAWNSLLGALEETLPAPDQWPQTPLGDPKLPTLALLEQDYKNPPLEPKTDFCDPSTRVVIGVFSQATNFWARQLSRMTWASEREARPQRVCVVYILAQPHTQHQVLNVRRMIEEEAERWGDLLQIQAPESYSLLPIKSLAFLSWTQRVLPQVFASKVY